MLSYYASVSASKCPFAGKQEPMNDRQVGSQSLSSSVNSICNSQWRNDMVAFMVAGHETSAHTIEVWL